MNLDLFDAPADEPGGEEPEEAAAVRPEEASGGRAEPEEGADLPGAEEETVAGEGGESRAAASPDEPRVWSVSEVNRAVRGLLEDTLPALWVGGEIGSWTRARSGHRYFTLKDESAQIDCVLWRRDAERLPADPEEGTEVRVHGSLTLYEARGRYQLVVRRLEAEGGEGLWRIAFEKLKKKLQEEGFLAPERKRPLPRFPQRIGIVTSTTGAALRDVLTVLRRRAPWTRVLVRGTRVQGEGASAEIADAIRFLGSSGRVDLLIVGRGGGSIEDLWAFNEEPVARAISACPVPVISAVGHEVDVTIADLVADHRAPTPSAAGEAAVPDAEALLEGLRRVRPRLARSLRGAVQGRWQRLDDGYARLARAVERTLAPRRQALERRLERLAREMRALVDRRRRRLAGAAGKVEALSPLSTLRRGYAVPLEGDRVLRGVADFREDAEFVLRVVDGRVGCRVLDTVREEVSGG